MTALPRFVILETSGRTGQVALAEGETICAVRRLDEARRHARDLVPAMAELLTAQHWRPRDLHAVLVSRGPGSYTGLRVGIMSAKTFAYAVGCRLLAVDTFAAIALQASEEARVLDVLADAQQDKMYVQRFARSLQGAEWQATSPLAIVPIVRWLGTLDGDVWVSGPGLRVHFEQLPQATRTVGDQDWDPRPESLLRLGLARYLKGESDSPFVLEPLYLRPSSAEEKWRERVNSNQ